MSEESEEVLEAEELAHVLGFWHLWAIGVGAVVGDGIFLLIGAGIATAGPAAILAYFGAGLFMLFIAIGVSDLAVGLPSAGAMWIWGREILGDYAGFVSGISYAVGWIVAGGSVGLAIGRITNAFFVSNVMPAAYWGILFVTIFAIIQLGGVLLSGRVQLYTVLTLVGIMLVFGISTMLHGDWTTERFIPFFPKGVGAVWTAMAFGMYAYMGPLTLTTAGDEVKEPSILPKALIAASLTFLVLYTVAMVGMIGLVDWQQFSALTSPFTETGKIVWGNIAGMVINFAAWLAAFTCLFMGTMYSAPRILWKMGDMKIIPDIFSNVWKKTKVPMFSTLFVWICSVGLILSAYYEWMDYAKLSLLLVFAWEVTWGIVLVAAVKYRMDYPDRVKGQSWIQPLFPLFPILGMIGVIIIFYGTFKGAWVSFGLGIVFLVVLTVIYFAYGKRRMDEADLPKVLEE